MSVPNQKTIIIHQSEQIPFLKIGIEELFEAYRNIKTPSSFILYLYLASNKDGFKLELSKEAFANATTLSKTSYHRAVDHLTELGYIYEDNGSLNFATVPKVGKRGVVQSWEKDNPEMKCQEFKDETPKSQICNVSYSEMNTEINNKVIIDKTEKTNNPSSSKDYSYLDALVSYDDGSYMWNGVVHFIDGNDPTFYDKPRGYQEAIMAQKTPFDMGAIEYILSKMEEQNNE